MSIIPSRFMLLFVLAVANAALHAMAAPIFYPGASGISVRSQHPGSNRMLVRKPQDVQDFLSDDDEDDDIGSDVTAPIRSELPEPTQLPPGGTKFGSPLANEADESGANDDDEVEESTSTTLPAPPTSAPTGPLITDGDDEAEDEETTASTSTALSTSASTSSTSANPSPTDNDESEDGEDEDEEIFTSLVTSTLPSISTSASSATSSSPVSVPTFASMTSASSSLSTATSSSSVSSSTTPSSSITSTSTSAASSPPSSTRSSSTSPTASTTSTDDLKGTTIILTYGNTATLGLPSGVPTPAPGQSLSDAVGDKDLNDIINKLLGATETPTATTNIAPTPTAVGADMDSDVEDDSDPDDDTTPTTAKILPGQPLMPTQFRPLPSLLGQLAQDQQLTGAPGPTFTPFFPSPTTSADLAGETQNDDDDDSGSRAPFTPFDNGDDDDGDNNAPTGRPDPSHSGFDAPPLDKRPPPNSGAGNGGGGGGEGNGNRRPEDVTDDTMGGPEDPELPEPFNPTLPLNRPSRNDGGPAIINIRTSSVSFSATSTVPAAATFATLDSTIQTQMPTPTRTVKIKITIEKEE